MKMKKIVLLIIGIMFLVSCSKGEEVDNVVENRLQIAVSIVPEETFVKKIGGDLVDIVTIIPPGQSPANYAPSPLIMKQLEDSDLYFSIGVPAEEVSILPKIEQLAAGAKLVKLNEEVEKKYEDLFFSENSRDPHIWMSPKRVMTMVDVIQEELSIIDPENSDFYAKRAESYKDELEDLDLEIKKSIVGLKEKTIIVYHPSFGYFADDYGLSMIALEEDGKEATPERLMEVIDLAKDRGIKSVFYQSEIDSKQSELVANEIGGKAIELEPLSSNYIENLRKTVDLFNSVSE
ncbi:metal ABC transporter solute-binding protein, Zn/Mn family [Clostridium sp. DL1XJH146]